ncbi:heterokaryon incompatibility protein-domain-containing protein [Fusarium venenatum]|uniref:heterokaryon incompatibility protein-domain-containing protein n=1 Tax=Fusarium venenatum TaxID=56646 RepID=UPI001D727D62|nr:heterokaryon incompatibility protein-domain-containing protein [Fusarium venenatum]
MAPKFLSFLPRFSSAPSNDICPNCKNLAPEISESATRIDIPLSKIQKPYVGCAHCKLLHAIYNRYNISVDCTGIIVDCTWNKPVILKFKDTLNDHFASWHLLYKPQGASISSWPCLGGPGESLGHLGSGPSLKFLRDRMNECLDASDDSHAACQQAVSNPLPKRVLDVREDKVMLCNTADQSGNYCALSYRWGPPEETLRTTDSNIDSMMSGIELSSLPGLLRDAVSLTRQLNVPYLWIDALCIIQGNKQDWEAEAPKMGEYYKNAILTIAASLANQVSENFLVPREEIPQERLSNLDFTNSDGTTSQVIVRRIPDYAGIPLVASSPLSTRAWTWQENVLSTRIAHFSKTEIIWECRSHQAFENGAKLGCSVGLAYRYARAGDDLEYYWKALVTDYSKRELTYESDRLPAISSVALHFSTLVPGRYLAGVWEQWLFSDMAWWPSWGVENKFPPMSKTRSEMPSWSWASITGQVHFALETCVNSDKLSAIKFIHGDCASTSGNNFMQPKQNSSIVVEAPACLVEISSTDVLSIGHYEINEKEDTWGMENVLQNRRKKSGMFHPDTVLLPDGQVTTSQGIFTSVRRSRKDEVTSLTALKTTVFCLHLGGGRYPELPNQTISSIPRYRYTQFWLVLSPVKEQEGQYISLRRLGLLSHGSQTIMRAKTSRVRLV